MLCKHCLPVFEELFHSVSRAFTAVNLKQKSNLLFNGLFLYVVSDINNLEGINLLLCYILSFLVLHFTFRCMIYFVSFCEMYVCFNFFFFCIQKQGFIETVLRKTIFSPVLLLLLCQRSGYYIYVCLFLGSFFDLPIYFSTHLINANMSL